MFIILRTLFAPDYNLANQIKRQRLVIWEPDRFYRYFYSISRLFTNFFSNILADSDHIANSFSAQRPIIFSSMASSEVVYEMRGTPCCPPSNNMKLHMKGPPQVNPEEGLSCRTFVHRQRFYGGRRYDFPLFLYHSPSV